MKTLQFTYEMRTDFDTSIWNHHYTLKCIPKDSERQQIQQCGLKIEPEGSYEWAEDSLVQSPFTEPGDGLKQYFDTLSCIYRMERPYDKALSIMENLEKDFRYCQGVTDVGTTAEEAWRLGCGVCQDWCHIMLGLCRMAGIPCRYVVGMLTGEGYSHAWVEIEEGGFWYALDPTNHMVVKDEHIKISSGRDYHDCIVEKGIFRGGCGQTQKIRVSVEEV